MTTDNTNREVFPDGSPIDPWFYDIETPSLSSLGTPYRLTDHGIAEDGRIHTAEIQKLIDEIAENGGGVLIVPKGTFRTGAIFFKQGVSLYLEAGAILMGSDDILDYPLLPTRIEGQNCIYFSALINADSVDGFSITGEGTIDGNGLHFWKSFWLRRKWNPDCTNKDEHRPRLVHISNSKNVLLSGVTLQNAAFWTTHIYKCSRVKYLNCRIISPEFPVKAPSTDAIDLDVVTDVLVKGCYMAVNDDSVVLKGGKGPWADSDENNGENRNVLIEDCTYGFCHGCLTCGSESIHNRNILIRRLKVEGAINLLWLKLRPDTPQHYEYIRMENVDARVVSFLNIHPWTQFFDLMGRTDKPVSRINNISMKDIRCECDHFYDVVTDDSQYLISDISMEDIFVKTLDRGLDPSAMSFLSEKGVHIEISNGESLSSKHEGNLDTEFFSFKK